MHPGDAMAELSTWLGDSSGTNRGLWYLFVQIVLQLTTAVLLGIVTAQPWAQSTTGGMSLLIILLVLQLIGAFWSFYHTANDLVDGFEKELSSSSSKNKTLEDGLEKVSIAKNATKVNENLQKMK